MNQETIQINGSIFSKDNFEQLKKNDEAPDSWENAIFLFLKNWFDDTDFVTTHTSGSTGIPKEIRLAKTAMRNSARMTNTFFGLDEKKNGFALLASILYCRKNDACQGYNGRIQPCNNSTEGQSL